MVENNIVPYFTVHIHYKDPWFTKENNSSSLTINDIVSLFILAAWISNYEVSNVTNFMLTLILP